MDNNMLLHGNKSGSTRNIICLGFSISILACLLRPWHGPSCVNYEILNAWSPNARFSYEA
eukprot:6847174-Pyramimonas_sp.AAC.1